MWWAWISHPKCCTMRERIFLRRALTRCCSTWMPTSSISLITHSILLLRATLRGRLRTLKLLLRSGVVCSGRAASCWCSMPTGIWSSMTRPRLRKCAKTSVAIMKKRANSWRCARTTSRITIRCRFLLSAVLPGMFVLLWRLVSAMLTLWKTPAHACTLIGNMNCMKHRPCSLWWQRNARHPLQMMCAKQRATTGIRAPRHSALMGISINGAI